jgi:hypothetical protein
VLQRLDRLTQDEARITAAEILKIVYGLVQDMSERIHPTHLLLIVEDPFRLDGKASRDSVLEALGMFRLRQQTGSMSD